MAAAQLKDLEQERFVAAQHEPTYHLYAGAEPALVNIDSPLTGGPFPSIEVGHTGLSKANAQRMPYPTYPE